jgi:uncharacterized tellurite resistance protein B-like protein
MAKELNFNQAVFGLMLLGAKADGRLQDAEKRLLVDLTSEEHHLTADEYKMVIGEAKNLSDAEFNDLIFKTLHQCTHQEKTKAVYWLLEVILSDQSSNNTPDLSHNEKELKIYRDWLVKLALKNEEIEAYRKSRQN